MCLLSHRRWRRDGVFLVGEDDDTLWFLNKTQTVQGHRLVIPKDHYTDLLSTPVEVAASVMKGAHRAASALAARLNPAGLSLFQFNGEAGWQDVFHLETIATALGATRRG